MIKKILKKKRKTLDLVINIIVINKKKNKLIELSNHFYFRVHLIYWYIDTPTSLCQNFKIGLSDDGLNLHKRNIHCQVLKIKVKWQCVTVTYMRCKSEGWGPKLWYSGYDTQSWVS